MKYIFAVLMYVLVVMIHPVLSMADFYVVAAGKRAVRTVLVSPKSTPVQSGQSLLAALDKITDASAAKPYLMIIEPGIYDVGNTPVQMKEFVDIQGSGQGVTTIRGSLRSITTEPTGVLIGSDNAELRSLTVKNIIDADNALVDGGDYVVAILNHETSPSLLYVTAMAAGGQYNYGVRNDRLVTSSNIPSPKMLHVTAMATGVSTEIAIYNHGVYNMYSTPNMTNVISTASGGMYNYGIVNAASNTIMDHVTATATGGNFNYGIYNEWGASTTMRNVQATGWGGGMGYGVWGDSEDLNPHTRINNSVISGQTSSVYLRGSSERCSIGNSQLIGGPAWPADRVKCAGVFDSFYNFWPGSVCP